MRQTVNVWIAMSQQALDEYREARKLKRDYDGPMDAETYDTLRRMADTDNVQAMFKRVPAGGKEYTLFSLYLPARAEAKTRIDHIADQWTNHFIVIGAWHWDGRQVGTDWIMETITGADGIEHEQRTDKTTGDPVYPLHAQAWKLMPDVAEYDIDGNETNRSAATSNADLRDINLLQGQEPRVFAV